MNKLRQIREEKKMTQEKLSQLSNVSRVTISNIESGTVKNINLGTLRKLAEALDVPIGYFF